MMLLLSIAAVKAGWSTLKLARACQSLTESARAREDLTTIVCLCVRGAGVPALAITARNVLRARVLTAPHQTTAPRAVALTARSAARARNVPVTPLSGSCSDPPFG